MKYEGNDFYCDIALQGKIHLKREYESANVLAYHHTRPHWPVHIVVVPKKHISSFTSLDTKETSILFELIDVLKQCASRIEKEYGAARIITNLGEYQDSKHLHFHIISGDEIKNK